MKKFSDLREAYYGKGKKLQNEKTIFNKKLMGVPVKISSYTDKGKTKFCVYIDGDKLDVYNSEREAMKTANEFVKQYRKSR